jgi:hypothetical protein
MFLAVSTQRVTIGAQQLRRLRFFFAATFARKS